MPNALDGFDQFLKREMTKWEVPGAAIGIVEGKRPAYQRGFGIRDARSGLEVDPNTLFSIAAQVRAELQTEGQGCHRAVDNPRYAVPSDRAPRA